MEPTPQRLCVYCNQQKPWIDSGKKLKDGSRIFTNHNNARWSGRRCPDCERSRVYAAIRSDSLERQKIIDQLTQAGFKICSKNIPFKVEKDGKRFTVGIRHAYTEDGKIIVSYAPGEDADYYALVFSSVRLCSKEYLAKLSSSLSPIR